MWDPGVLVWLRGGCGGVLRPPQHGWDEPVACTVVHVVTQSWGTRGPTCRYILLVRGSLYVATLNNVTSENNFMLETVIR